MHLEFRLAPKTLHLAVSYLDRLLVSRPAIPRSRFQLFGLTCLWVASKFEDVMTNSIQDLVWICDDAYTRQDFEEAERELLALLNWNLNQITSCCFLSATLHGLPAEMQDPVLENLSHCIIELALTEHGVLRAFLPSTLAAGALAVSFFRLTGKAVPANLLKEHLGCDVTRADDSAALCTRQLHDMYRLAHQGQAHGSHIPVFEKYGHSDRRNVSTLAPRDGHIFW